MCRQVISDSRRPWRGTRLWKEFRIEGRRVETRCIESTVEGWQFAVYLWSEDESEAPLAPERGTRARAEVAPGLRHVIPLRYDCRACREGRPVPVLAFTALQLSPDRDPNAPHAERPGAGPRGPPRSATIGGSGALTLIKDGTFGASDQIGTLTIGPGGS